MGPLFSYSLAVSMAMLILWAGYRLGRGHHAGTRRLSVLAIYAISLAGVPMLLYLHDVMATSLPAAAAPTIASDTPLPYPAAALPVGAAGSARQPLISLLLAIYICGVAISLIMTSRELLRVLALIRGAECRRFGNRRVYVIDRPGIAPFSLGRIIVLNRTDAESHAIMSHEAAHLRRHHSADLILAQAVAALCWYCPAAWLLRSELKLIHEFQADADVIRGGADVRSYSLLLISHATRMPVSTLTNNFNTNNLKLRIRMMQSPLSARRRPWRLLLPAAALLGAAVLSASPAVTDSLAMVARSTLISRGLNVNSPDHAFVIYGLDLDSPVIASGNFPDVADFRSSDLTLDRVDGVIFPKAGALFTSRTEVLRQLAPHARKYMVDGTITSATEFENINAGRLAKVVVAGGVIIAYTTADYDLRFNDCLQNAIKANN